MSTVKRPDFRRSPAALILLCAPALALCGAGVTGQTEQTEPTTTLESNPMSPTSVLEDTYRDHLVAWARGDASRAKAYAETELHAVERIAGAPVTPKNFDSDDVLRGERCAHEVAVSTGEAIAREDPEALLAVAVFDFEVYHDHREGRRPGLAENTWRRVAVWRSLYRRAHTAIETDAREDLALQAIYMAGRLTGLTLRGEQRRALALFERAAELAPANPVAAYWEGFLREKFGLYKKAVVSLGRLAVERPEDWELQLRWALNLARTGSPERAEELLDEVAVGARQEWIRIVAYQELVRLRLARDPKAGMIALRRALEVYPRDEQLRVALAFSLGPASAEGRRVIGDLHAPSEGALEVDPAGAPRPAPRLRYEEPRQVGLEREIERFGRHLVEKQRALVDALDAVRLAERHGGRRRASIRACRALGAAQSG